MDNFISILIKAKLKGLKPCQNLQRKPYIAGRAGLSYIAGRAGLSYIAGRAGLSIVVGEIERLSMSKLKG